MPDSLTQLLPERIRKRFLTNDAVKTYGMMFTTFTCSPNSPVPLDFGHSSVPRFVTVTQFPCFVVVFITDDDRQRHALE